MTKTQCQAQEISFQVNGQSSSDHKASRPLPMPWGLPETEGTLLAEETIYFRIGFGRIGVDLTSKSPYEGLPLVDLEGAI